MKKIVILDKETIKSLHKVVRDYSPVKIGDFFALDGAWDHKKIVENIGPINPVNFDHPKIKFEQTVWLQNVGRIFSDGRAILPTKPSSAVEHRVFYVMNARGEFEIHKPEFGGRGYVKVIPKPVKREDLGKLSLVKYLKK